MGLHRPHHTSDFLPQVTISADQTHERILAWIQSFSIHQSVASMLGLPSCLSEDWVTSTTSHSVEACWGWIRSLNPDIPKLLRIQRFALRLSTVLGNNAASTSGQNDDLTAPALISLLSRELLDIETSLAPMSPIVSVRLLEAKLSLYTFCLQENISAVSTYTQEIIACYTSAVRILDILKTLSKSPDAPPVFWPRSLHMCLVFAPVSCVVLQ
jgi:hypothetical protein